MSEPSSPFVGAGDANYFEWAEMFVAFERAPAKATAAAIAKRVPPPLRDTIEWNGRVLWVASEQGVGRTITAAYGKQNKAPTKLTTKSQFKIAPASAYGRFNADIDAWLEFANTKSPILVAMRAEDAEAGGTVLSDWHRRSLASLPKVLANLAKDDEGHAAKLGARLLDFAKAGKVKVDASVAKSLVRRAKEAEKEEDDAAPDWDALAATAKKALGAPAPNYTKKRTAEDLTAAFDRLGKVLPLTAKRLRNLAKKGLAVRPGATAASIAAAEKALGVKLSKEHRALLEAFDGGVIGRVVVLGTEKGGAVRDAELANFTKIWSGAESEEIVIAHTKRDRVLTIPRGKSGPASIVKGKPGWGGGMVFRECKTLDTALDLVFKAGWVFDN
jgi:hypothetical protein